MQAQYQFLEVLAGTTSVQFHELSGGLRQRDALEWNGCPVWRQLCGLKGFQECALWNKKCQEL